MRRAIASKCRYAPMAAVMGKSRLLAKWPSFRSSVAKFSTGLMPVTSCRLASLLANKASPQSAPGLICVSRTTTILAMNARDEIVDFLVDQIPTNALAGFQPSTEARERIWELIAREKDAGLLPEEKLELDDYMKLEHLLVLAKAKARLAQRNG